MLRVADGAELAQVDVQKYADKFGIKQSDIEKVTAAAKQAKAVYDSTKKKKPSSEPVTAAPFQQQYTDPPASGIGTLPILAILAGVGILAFVFLKK